MPIRLAVGFSLGVSVLFVNAGAATAQSSSTGSDRTWLGWASGFVAVIAVIGLAAGAVVWIRRKR